MSRPFFKRSWVKIVCYVVIAIFVILDFFYLRFQPAKNITWGVNFSPTYAQYLGFNSETAFLDIVNDLNPQKIRLVSYWETIEPQKGKFDFSQLDFMLQEAAKRNIGITLVIGHKQPRWPECHEPGWYTKLPQDQKDQALMDMLRATVNHFKSFQAVERWQVENEPFFNYGENCPVSTQEFLEKEINLVKSLDPRPIVLTDSGEKGEWFTTARLADIFGSTMYRVVFNPKYGGYIKYPLPPAFYRIRAGMLKTFTKINKIIGVELQAEPWFAKDINDTTLQEQAKLMNPQIFQENVNYARGAGFAENYFWGVEWWYWLKNKQNDASMWEAAKAVFAQDK